MGILGNVPGLVRDGNAVTQSLVALLDIHHGAIPGSIDRRTAWHDDIQTIVRYPGL